LNLYKEAEISSAFLICLENSLQTTTMKIEELKQENYLLSSLKQLTNFNPTDEFSHGKFEV
jgi:hypothetical protein